MKKFILLALALAFMAGCNDHKATVEEKIAKAEQWAFEDVIDNFMKEANELPVLNPDPKAGRKWQYVSIDMDGYPAQDDTMLLNKMDAKGWELCGTVYGSYVFKRPFGK